MVVAEASLRVTLFRTAPGGLVGALSTLGSARLGSPGYILGKCSHGDIIATASAGLAPCRAGTPGHLGTGRGGAPAARVLAPTLHRGCSSVRYRVRRRTYRRAVGHGGELQLAGQPTDSRTPRLRAQRCRTVHRAMHIHGRPEKSSTPSTHHSARHATRDRSQTT